MSEWEQITLGEVASVVGGGTPSTKEESYWGGDVLWLTPGELTKREGRVITGTERRISAAGLANSSAKMLPKDAVLLTSRATVGAVGLAGQPMTTNQGFQSLIAGPRVLPRFLMNWVQGNREEFESRASGSTFPEISGKKIKAIPLSVPPLAEQRRIVDVMAAVDAQIEALEAEAAALATYLGSVTESLWQAPEKVAISTIGGVVTGSTPSTKEPSNWDSPDVRFLTPGDLSTLGFVDTQTARAVSEAGARKARLLDGAGVAVVCIGATIGKVGIFDGQLVSNQQINSVLCATRLDAIFLAAVLAAQQGQSLIRAASGSSTMPLLSKSGFSVLEVPWPDSSERKETALYVESVLNAERKAHQEAATLRDFRTTLLSALLSQQVEIPESYDALLDDAVEVSV